MNKQPASPHHFQRKISEFCQARISPLISGRELQNIHSYLTTLILHRKKPPMRGYGVDWGEFAEACGVESELTQQVRQTLRPALDAIIRWLRETRSTRTNRPVIEAPERQARSGGRAGKAKVAKPKPLAPVAAAKPQSAKAKQGPRPKPIDEFPKSLFESTKEPEGFQEALTYHMRRHGETYWHLHQPSFGPTKHSIPKRSSVGRKARRCRARSKASRSCPASRGAIGCRTDISRPGFRINRAR